MRDGANIYTRLYRPTDETTVEEQLLGFEEGKNREHYNTNVPNWILFVSYWCA